MTPFRASKAKRLLITPRRLRPTAAGRKSGRAGVPPAKRRGVISSRLARPPAGLPRRPYFNAQGAGMPFALKAPEWAGVPPAHSGR